MIDILDGGEHLKSLVRALWEKAEGLEAEVEQLKAENAELRRRLGLDSTNSDKPPSSDGYRKKPISPGIPKKKGGRKGGQNGHKGKTLERIETPDHVCLLYTSDAADE